MYIDIPCIIWILAMYSESPFSLCTKHFLEFIVLFFFKLEKKFFFSAAFKIQHLKFILSDLFISDGIFSVSGGFEKQN